MGKGIWHFSPLTLSLEKLATPLLLEFLQIFMLFQNWWEFLSAWRAWGPVLLLPPGHYYLARFECASFHGNDYCLGPRSLATLSGNVKILIWNNLIINLTDWHVKNNSDPDFRINVWNISTINMKGWDALKVLINWLQIQHNFKITKWQLNECK